MNVWSKFLESHGLKKYRNFFFYFDQKYVFGPELQHLTGNTLKPRAPLKKPASETTYFELLVLAFRVFEFQRSKVENSEEVRS